MARGLCASHYRMNLRGEELRPIKDYQYFLEPAPGKKICGSCERVLDADKDFYRRAHSDKPQPKCKDCAKKRAAELRQAAAVTND